MNHGSPRGRSPVGPRGRQQAPAKSKPGRKRITKSLVALSSAAILTVYGVGYVSTQSAEQQLSSPTQAAAVAIHAVPAGSVPLATALVPSPTQAQADAAPPTPSAAAPVASTAAAPSPTHVAQAGAYRDGTYVGTGSNRHADIEATVTVQGGRIVSAQISQCQTRYPCSLINGLPSQIVSRQKAQINMVSGATDSSRAFLEAVTQALSQAL